MLFLRKKRERTTFITTSPKNSNEITISKFEVTVLFIQDYWPMHEFDPHSAAF